MLVLELREYPLNIYIEDFKTIFFLNSRSIPDLMENPEVVRIAKSLGKTPAQILLRHLLQRGVAAIPKSTNADRLKLNIELFDFVISEKDMVVLGDLDADIRVCDFAFFKG